MSKRNVTREYVLEASRQAGFDLADQRIDELVPLLQAVLDGMKQVRELVDSSDVEPSPTFHVLEE